MKLSRIDGTGTLSHLTEVTSTGPTRVMDFFFEPEIESPCVKVCVIDPSSGYCIGCGRTKEEIASWLGFSSEERRRIIGALEARIAGLTNRRRRKGGRRGRNNENEVV